jgi:hypothetical protein
MKPKCGGVGRLTDKRNGDQCVDASGQGRAGDMPGAEGNRKGRTRAVSHDINVLALVKGAERYVFLYDDASRAETLRTLGRFASNPELSFTWYDAAVLSQKIRQEAQKAVPCQRRFDVPLPTDPEELA